MFKEIDGDLIKLAKEGKFDVITHGCNCFCTMGAGIAPKMAKAFGCDRFLLEEPRYRGDIKKLGQIDYKTIVSKFVPMSISPVLKDRNLVSIECKQVVKLTVVNSYTQFYYGKNHSDGVKNPIDYEALTLCMRKINHVFKGKKLGVPLIGCGLAGGKEEIVIPILKKELQDMDVMLVRFKS